MNEEAAPQPEAPAGTPLYFGPYQTVRKLGEGAFGRVYLARDTELDRDVAVKVPKVPIPSDQHRNFFREARAVVDIYHPNVCPVYHVAVQDGCPYIVMKYAPRTLKDLIASGPLPSEQALGYAKQIADGLTAAHAKNVIHRDLKPENVLHDDETCNLLLTDFGIAYWDDGTNPMRDLKAGTPLYMAPEQWDSGQFGPVSERTDIYALGAMLFTFLTGARLFDASGDALGYHHRNIPPRRPSELRADLDPGLDELCLTALAKRPDERYRTARAFAEAITGCLNPGPPAPVQEVLIRVTDPMGHTCDVGVPGDMSAEVLARQLASHFSLAASDADGQALVWPLFCAATGRELSPARTLAQNGIRDGHRLHLSSRPAARPAAVRAAPAAPVAAAPNEIGIQVMDPMGNAHPVSVRRDCRTDAFVGELRDALRLARTDAEGHPIAWWVYSKATGRELVPDRTLQQNGVEHGHRLYLVRRTVAGGPAPDRQPA